MKSDISLLNGKTLTQVEQSSDDITFTCDDGDTFLAYHMQDCCEVVRIHDVTSTSGNGWNGIIGKPIISAVETRDGENWPSDVPKDEYTESFTWTTYTIQTADDTIVVRWLGESNGYYGESVYVRRTHANMTISKHDSSWMDDSDDETEIDDCWR